MTESNQGHRRKGATAKARGASIAAPAGRRPSRKTRTAPPPIDAGEELALIVARAALEKKAVAIEILDVRGKVDYADLLVLMTGRSNRHVQSVAQGIEEEAAKHRRRALSVEGLPAADWVLIDFGDVVVHVFQEHARGLYDIEGLWLDAARLPVPGAVAE